MKMLDAKLLKACQNKWRNVGSRGEPSDGACRGKWYALPLLQQNNLIPKDVPKGHLAVYVGENYKRHIIKISLLKHPLFKALLDLAQEVYDFATGAKLCIPCDEYVFLQVLGCASHSDESRCSFCL
uniref:Small auxin up regulated protein n=1 Tax=Kalanchoe fedtschenkoi TaxID=63787 RepID=A0A7N0RHG4_KALFE